jgi:hypothetical protein
MSRPSHSSRFYHPTYVGWGVQIIKHKLKFKQKTKLVKVFLTHRHEVTKCSMDGGRIKSLLSWGSPLYVHSLETLHLWASRLSQLCSWGFRPSRTWSGVTSWKKESSTPQWTKVFKFIFASKLHHLPGLR